MARRANETTMAAIHAKVAELLLDSLNGEEVTPSTLKTAIDFLHKNNITADLGSDEASYMQKLSKDVIQITKEDVAQKSNPDIVDDPEVLRKSLRLIVGD